MRHRVNYRTEIMLWGLSSAVLVLVGCAAPYTYYCDDGCGPPSLSGRHAGCDVAPCEPAAGMPVDPLCGGSACGGAPCGGSVTQAIRNMFTCGSGCGEIYWGEWCYDPPDQCDPCNNHGDWTGPGCCPPSCWTRLWQGLTGARFCEATCEPACGVADCGVAACDSCDGSGPTMLDSEPQEPMGEFEFLETVSEPELPPTASRRNPHPSPSSASRNPNSRLVRRPTR